MHALSSWVIPLSSLYNVILALWCNSHIHNFPFMILDTKVCQGYVYIQCILYIHESVYLYIIILTCLELYCLIKYISALESSTEVSKLKFPSSLSCPSYTSQVPRLSVVTVVYCTLNFQWQSWPTASCGQLCIENLPAIKVPINTVPTIVSLLFHKFLCQPYLVL